MQLRRLSWWWAKGTVRGLSGFLFGRRPMRGRRSLLREKGGGAYRLSLSLSRVCVLSLGSSQKTSSSSLGVCIRSGRRLSLLFYFWVGLVVGWSLSVSWGSTLSAIGRDTSLPPSTAAHELSLNHSPFSSFVQTNFFISLLVQTNRS